MDRKISVDNNRLKELTGSVLFSSQVEEEVMSEALANIYSGIIVMAICGIVEDSLDELLSAAHDNVKSTYMEMRKQLSGITYDA